MEGTTPRPRALLSVWDKSGIVEFGQGLAALGFELLSTGGTARTLREAGLDVLDVSEVTGHPEIFDGRVKSLHPAVHGPLLARLEREDDARQLHALGYAPIEVVAVNLYPFAAAAAQDPPLDDAALLEMIDIGGPTLVRASAKNHRNVVVVVDPARYGDVLDALGNKEGVPMEVRRHLALEAYAQTSAYDAAIVDSLHRRWVGSPEDHDTVEAQTERLPISSNKPLGALGEASYPPQTTARDVEEQGRTTTSRKYSPA
jgi:phosphoribosylaminoimidazolecarboxamide formyltransferase/IMP cyclohydrolase